MAGSIREATAYAGEVDWTAQHSSGGPPPDPSVAARVQRAEADARLQAFAAGRRLERCKDLAPADRFVGGCLVDDVDAVVLYRREGQDVDAVDPRDVSQGALPDCYILAVLAAMAQTREGRAALRAAIVENKNDEGHVVSYTVTLHELQKSMLGSTSFHDVRVTVDGDYVLGHAHPRDGDGRNEVWPLVIEKAFAKYMGGYDKIGRGGLDSSDVMTLLTGRKAKQFSLDWPRRLVSPYSEARLATDRRDGKIIVLGTRTGIGGRLGSADAPSGPHAGAYGLVERHAYFVTGTEQRNGKTFLQLGNPWGHTQPDDIPVDEMTTWFSSVSVGSTH